MKTNIYANKNKQMNKPKHKKKKIVESLNTFTEKQNSPMIVDLKCPAWNFFAIFGELQNKTMNSVNR